MLPSHDRRKHVRYGSMRVTTADVIKTDFSHWLPTRNYPDGKGHHHSYGFIIIGINLHFLIYYFTKCLTPLIFLKLRRVLN